MWIDLLMMLCVLAGNDAECIGKDCCHVQRYSIDSCLMDKGSSFCDVCSCIL